jgi:hypothetical protein
LLGTIENVGCSIAFSECALQEMDIFFEVLQICLISTGQDGQRKIPETYHFKLIFSCLLTEGAILTTPINQQSINFLIAKNKYATQLIAGISL